MTNTNAATKSPRKSTRTARASAIANARANMAENMRQARYWARDVRRGGGELSALLMRQCRWLASDWRSAWRRLAGLPVDPRALCLRGPVPTA